MDKPTKVRDHAWYRHQWKAINLRFRAQDEDWNESAPLQPGSWTARKYRYADGRVHRNTVLVIFYAHPKTGEVSVVGGVVMLRDGDVVAYLGDVNPAERYIEIRKQAKALVIGTNLMQVLIDLKKAYPHPLRYISAETTRNPEPVPYLRSEAAVG